ncbi:MAG: hypothetical protein HZA51_07090 [Planctomycetes bacterium]|nr:hypothetical protein [Planctomycetota bacterium]
MNKTWQRLPSVLIVIVLASPAAVRAQDSVTEILRKPALTPTDRGTLEAEISQRVKRTFGGSTPVNVNEARDRLAKPAKEKDVSKEGLNVYSEIVAAELETPAASEDLNTSLTAVLILEDLECAPTVGALITATKNKHPAVRYAATRGIANLRTKIKDDESTCRKAFAALGEAGAKEKDEHVRRRIYQALNVKEAAADFKHMEPVAAALNAVLAARISELAGGSNDEYRDEEAVSAAVGCYVGCSARQQAALVGNLFSLLRHTVDHYFDAGTALEALPTIARLAQRFEKGLTEMMKAAKVSAPSRQVSDLLKAGADRQKAEKDARAALDDLRKTLRGEPWRLP